jgi:hypothetical protein
MKRKTSTAALDKVAYCGLCCGDCPGHTQRIADLALDLRRELQRVTFEETAELFTKQPAFAVFRHYDKACDVLGALTKLRCKTPCRAKPAGETKCRIRACCITQGFMGCWECSSFERCETLKAWELNHGDAMVRNLRALKRKGVAGFLSGKRYWYSRPR